jgi:drug/metabolite transporter (DMT)-like permease
MNDLVLLLALLSATFFGSALVLSHFGLRSISPVQGAVVSIPSSALFFLVLSPFFVDWMGLNLQAVGIFVAIGLLFPVFVTLLTFQSNKIVGPNITGAIGNLAPLFAVLFAVLFLKEMPRGWQMVGIATIIIGVSLMSLQKKSSVVWPIITLLMPLTAALIRGLVQPVIKIGLEYWADPFAATLIGYLVSTIVVLGVAFSPKRAALFTFDKVGVAWFIGVGLCNGMAVFIMYMALARGPVTLVAPIIALYPLITLTLSALLLSDQRLTKWLVAGTLISIAGVILLLTA